MANIDPNSMFSLSCGLYVLTSRDNKRDHGCIINTAMQITSNPNRISIALNKENHTHGVIRKAGSFNISTLTEKTPFDVFRHFGFQSGRDVDKFAGEFSFERSENGLAFLPQYSNSFISGRVIVSYDYGTHSVFIAEVTEAQVLSSEKSLTYEYYRANIKPKPQTQKKRGFVCKICGYVHENGDLPKNFICPVCKHGAEVFEPVK